MARATFVLREERDRNFALLAVRRAPWGVQVRISKPTRTIDQNAHLHALCSQLSDEMPWPKDTGELHPVDFWKRSCTLGWLIETKQQYEVITSLEGHEIGILLPHTSDLSTEQCAELILWTTAFGAHNGIVWKEPDGRPEPPEEAYR